MKKIVLFKIILTFFLINAAWGQFYEDNRQSGAGDPFFNIELFRTISDDFKTGRLYVYGSLVNDDLTFVKYDTLGGFRAEFDWEVSVVHAEEGHQVASRSVHKEVYESDYNQTNNREKNILLTVAFDIPGGEYIITTLMRDLITKKVVSRKIEMKMYDYDRNEMDMSGLLFVNEAKFDSSGKPIHFSPRVMNNFSRETPMIYLYTEIFSNDYPGTVSIRYQLENEDEEIELDTVIIKELTEPLTSNIFALDKREIKKNRYQCIVTAQRGNRKVERQRNLSFYWISVPETREDISIAIRQMRYLISSDSLDRYEEGPLDEQQTFFERYWAARDPNPKTKANELMKEYFSRINYANRQYSSYSDDGWLSDRGRILIKFGYPDDVERHPFEMDSVPYVIWRYYSLRKVFVFTDRSGFGDYRLLPSYQGEEYR